MTEESAILTLVLHVCIGVFCVVRAGKLNRDQWGWGILGFTVSGLALLLILFAKPKTSWETVDDEKINKSSPWKSLALFLIFIVFVLPIGYGLIKGFSERDQGSRSNNIYSETVNQNEIVDNKASYTHIEKSQDISNQRYGYTKGSDIILRKRPSTKSDILGSFKYNNTQLIILDKQFTGQVQHLLNTDLTYLSDGYEFEVPKGKSVTILLKGDMTSTITFKNKNQEEFTTQIDNEFLEENRDEYWYHVEEVNGSRIGWIYGKFVRE